MIALLPFQNNIRSALGAAGTAWLDDLPVLLETYEALSSHAGRFLVVDLERVIIDR